MTLAPPPVPSADNQHLKLIEIFHYVLAGLSVVGMGFLFVHYMIFSTVFTNPQIVEQMRHQRQGQSMSIDPEQLFNVIKWFYLFLGVIIVVYLILNLISGLAIRARKARRLSLVVAGIDCMLVPFGTALGVFTIIVLLRPTVAIVYRETSVI